MSKEWYIEHIKKMTKTNLPNFEQDWLNHIKLESLDLEQLQAISFLFTVLELKATDNEKAG